MSFSETPLHPRGIIAAIPTPFTGDGSAVDEQALRRVVAHAVEGGVSGIMTTGGTGEFPHLSRSERQLVHRIVAEETRSTGVSVFAGTAACSTREAIALGNDAAEAGADAVILTPPFYFPLPLDSVRQHFLDVAAASPLPVVVYNNPLYTGINLPPQLIAELLEVPNVVGLKQSNANIGELAEVIRLAAPSQLGICTGIDSQLLSAVAIGAHGIFSSAAAIVPSQMVRLFELSAAGELELAREQHRKLQPLNKFLEYDPGYVSPTKEALRLLGIGCGPVRDPLPSFPPDDVAELEAALRIAEASVAVAGAA